MDQPMILSLFRLSEDMENFALQVQFKRTMLREMLSLEPS